MGGTLCSLRHAHLQIIGDPLEGKEALHIKAFFRRLELINLVVEVD